MTVTATVEFVRGPRPRPPELPTGDVVVGAPPAAADAGGGLHRWWPSVTLAVLAVVTAVTWSAASPAGGTRTAVLMPAMMLASGIGMAITAGRRGAPGLDEQRCRYLDRLESLGDQLADAAEGQRHSLNWVHPPPATLWTLIGGPRMWERRVGDSDFGHIRLGVARQRSCRRIVVPAVGPADGLEPVTADALRRWVHTYSTVESAPVALALSGVATVGVAGERGVALALVRAMVCQLAVLHSPGDVLIGAVTTGWRRADWDWLKWLPHNRSLGSGDPLVVGGVSELNEALAQDRRPRVVLVVDHGEPWSRARLEVSGPVTTAIVIGGGAEGLALRLDGDLLAAGAEVFARADALAAGDARTCARLLARYRACEPARDALDRWCADLAVVETPDARGELGWPPVRPDDRLRVPVGIGGAGELVHLDVKEAAEGGHGPHGLCVGVTGSGKSELLRTVVTGMVVRHSPDDLNLVLVDFKGGATFLGFEGLHHVAAVITNLAEEAALVARTREALGGEIHRRQQMLRTAGNAVNLAEYRRRRDVDPGLPPLPVLFVVVDEFVELLHQHPDFADLFAMLGRVGRSLGIHLLLACQRLDDGRLRGLESHLSYRICLKTASAAESRAVLGVPDAAELPSRPGAAVLRDGDGRLVQFQSIYLGADRQRPTGRGPGRVRECSTVRLFTADPVKHAAPQSDTGILPSAVDRIVASLEGRGQKAHPVWLPPPATSPALSGLLGAAGRDLTAPIGLLDLPFEQRLAPLVVDVGSTGGNVIVVGAPRTGKSTAVRTLVTALAARHDPDRIQFYCVDFGGGTLTALDAIPHVGTVAAGRDTDAVRATVAHVEAVLRSREARRSDGYGDVFLVVDGWSALREEFDDLEAPLVALAARGLSFGVHLVITAGRWADVRPALKDQLGTRIELRLGDPADSDADRRKAALVPLGVPGRGITSAGHAFVLATPDLPDVRWDRSRPAPPVRLLPRSIGHDAVIAALDRDHGQIVLGLGEADLGPVPVDLRRHPHLLVLGDGDCGKTATLRLLCREIVRTRPVTAARLFVVDYRRTLLGVVPPERLLGYAFSAAALAEELPALLALLERRIPGAGTPMAQLRSGRWWSGPEIYLMIDDYDVVSATPGEGLSPLLPMVLHAADIGLHVLLARRSAGAARAMFEPLPARLRDGGALGLLMNGGPDEGPLVGACRPAPQPPGRGVLVAPDARHLVQVGWCAP